MLPLYSCIISEHPGIPGGEVQLPQPRRVGGTCYLLVFENPFALFLPSPLYCHPRYQRCKIHAGHSAILISTLIPGYIQQRYGKTTWKWGRCLLCDSKVKCYAVLYHAAVCIVSPRVYLVLTWSWLWQNPRYISQWILVTEQNSIKHLYLPVPDPTQHVVQCDFFCDAESVIS